MSPCRCAKRRSAVRARFPRLFPAAKKATSTAGLLTLRVLAFSSPSRSSSFSGVWRRRLAAYSCGHSRGFSPRSLFSPIREHRLAAELKGPRGALQLLIAETSRRAQEVGGAFRAILRNGRDAEIIIVDHGVFQRGVIDVADIAARGPLRRIGEASADLVAGRRRKGRPAPRSTPPQRPV